jgi:uncharacterized protein YndB with AHSA1/START domain
MTMGRSWHNPLQMSGRTRGYAHRVDIAAGAAQVWTDLTQTESLRKWCSPEAYISAREGGHFRASVDRIIELEAHIDVWLPQRRMRLIYLPSEDLPENGSAIVDDFILDGSDPGQTVLRLLGSGFPATHASDALYLRLRTGWERAIARLKVLVERNLKESA